MSEDKVEPGAERAALKALEGAVSALLDEVGRLKKRTGKAEGRAAELQDLLERVTGGDADAAETHARLRDLENENRELRERLGEGRETVDRILAKIRFLEEQR